MRLKALGRLKQLRRMTVGEMAYRFCDKLRSETDRIQYYRRKLEKPEEELWSFFNGSISAGVRARLSNRNGFSFKEYLRGGPAQRFYLPSEPAERARLREFIEDCVPLWKHQAVEEAERICQHRVELLGYGEIDIGREINWHLDPITGRSWPRRFWADYDLVHDATAGDPKSVHELNRHQHLPRLAKAYFLTGKEKYAREAVDQIESWIDQNPADLGVNWHSSLEIGLRVVSWLWTLFFLLPAESFHEHAARRMGSSLLAQLEHVYRYPSIISSPNTHVVGEAAALFIGGLIFAECNRARAWRDRGSSLLIDAMGKQVSPEGIHQELSSYYHCYTADFYLQTLGLAHRNRFPFPDWLWKRLVCMLEFLMHLTRPDGTIPLLGDDDGGRALALHQTSYRSFRDGLCTGAVMFQRPEFKSQSGEFFEESLWLLGEQAWNTYAGLKSNPPQGLSASYPAAGYFIQRSDWTARARHLVFDCGGMGMINGGHGHADSLSLVLFAGGRELLVDPGTCIYNTAPAWRDFFRSTKAHNTAVVDGRDQSEMGATLRWNRIAPSRVVKHITSDGIDYVEGEHTGYNQLPQSVLHRRRVLYCRPEYWAVVDEFRGEGKHSIDLYYHFDSETEITSGESAGSTSDLTLLARAPGAGLMVFLRASAPLKFEIIRGQSTPIQGWVSSRYGEKKPALTLRVTFCSHVPAAIVSILAPFGADSDQLAARQNREGWECSGVAAGQQAIACSVKQGKREDLMIFSMQDCKLDVRDYKLQGELFWLHSEQAVLEKLFAVNARSFQTLERTLFQNIDSQSYVWKQYDKEDGSVEPSEAGETAYVRD